MKIYNYFSFLAYFIVLLLEKAISQSFEVSEPLEISYSHLEYNITANKLKNYIFKVSKSQIDDLTISLSNLNGTSSLYVNVTHPNAKKLEFIKENTRDQAMSIFRPNSKVNYVVLKKSIYSECVLEKTTDNTNEMVENIDQNNCLVLISVFTLAENNTFNLEIVSNIILNAAERIVSNKNSYFYLFNFDRDKATKRIDLAITNISNTNSLINGFVINNAITTPTQTNFLYSITKKPYFLSIDLEGEVDYSSKYKLLIILFQETSFTVKLNLSSKSVYDLKNRYKCAFEGCIFYWIPEVIFPPNNQEFEFKFAVSIKFNLKIDFLNEKLGTLKLFKSNDNDFVGYEITNNYNELLSYDLYQNLEIVNVPHKTLNSTCLNCFFTINLDKELFYDLNIFDISFYSEKLSPNKYYIDNKFNDHILKISIPNILYNSDLDSESLANCVFSEPLKEFDLRSDYGLILTPLRRQLIKIKENDAMTINTMMNSMMNNMRNSMMNNMMSANRFLQNMDLNSNTNINIPNQLSNLNDPLMSINILFNNKDQKNIENLTGEFLFNFSNMNLVDSLRELKLELKRKDSAIKLRLLPSVKTTNNLLQYETNIKDMNTNNLFFQLYKNSTIAVSLKNTLNKNKIDNYFLAITEIYYNITNFELKTSISGLENCPIKQYSTIIKQKDYYYYPKIFEEIPSSSNYMTFLSNKNKAGNIFNNKELIFQINNNREYLGYNETFYLLTNTEILCPLIDKNLTSSFLVYKTTIIEDSNLIAPIDKNRKYYLKYVNNNLSIDYEILKIENRQSLFTDNLEVWEIPNDKFTFINLDACSGGLSLILFDYDKDLTFGKKYDLVETDEDLNLGYSLNGNYNLKNLIIYPYSDSRRRFIKVNSGLILDKIINNSENDKPITIGRIFNEINKRILNVYSDDIILAKSEYNLYYSLFSSKEEALSSYDVLKIEYISKNNTIRISSFKKLVDDKYYYNIILENEINKPALLTKCKASPEYLAKINESTSYYKKQESLKIDSSDFLNLKLDFLKKSSLNYYFQVILERGSNYYYSNQIEFRIKGIFERDELKNFYDTSYFYILFFTTLSLIITFVILTIIMVIKLNKNEKNIELDEGDIYSEINNKYLY